MRRGFVAAVLIAIAFATAAQDAAVTPEKKPAQPSTAAKPKAQTSTTTKQKSQTSTTAKPKGTQPGAEAKKPAAESQEMKDLKLAKRKFMAAVGACARPEECDPTSRSANKDVISLLAEAEKDFMTACAACSTEEKCEKERQRIRDGKTSFGANPCK